MCISLSPCLNQSRERKRGYAKVDRHIPLINLLIINNNLSSSYLMTTFLPLKI